MFFQLLNLLFLVLNTYSALFSAIFRLLNPRKIRPCSRSPASKKCSFRNILIKGSTRHLSFVPLPCLFLFLKSNTNPVSLREAENKRRKESMISTPQKGSFLCGKGYKAQPQAEAKFLCHTRYPHSQWQGGFACLRSGDTMSQGLNGCQKIAP